MSYCNTVTIQHIKYNIYVATRNNAMVTQIGNNK